MIRFLIAGSLLCASSAAMAGSIPHGHSLPDEVSMFEKIRLTKAVGKVKGEGCEAALKLAMEDLAGRMEKKGTNAIVGIWTLNERKGWSFEPEVMCEDNGKKQAVKIEALNIAEGSGPAYQKVTGSRMLEIMSALQGDNNMMIGARVAGMRTLDYRGDLYYGAPRVQRKEYLTGNRNTRAVRLFRDDLLPQISTMGELLKAVPEFKGTEIQASYKYSKMVKGKAKELTEVFYFRVGTEAALQFFNGELSEQEFVDKGAVLFSVGKKPPVKIDISFVDAAD